MEVKVFKILLLPFSLIYGLIITIRNLFYQWGILKSASFNIPVIGVGNLSLGGAGKTPHVEYLIRLLSPHIVLGTLSRGYKRKTKGFRMVKRNDSALTVGDEPLQYHLKYPQVKVAVSESRSIGVPLLLSKHPDVQTILLDDSYQHLSVTPSLNILLTEYDYPYTRDILLPAGRLREWPSGAKRADIIIVSKCPEVIDNDTRMIYRKELEVEDHQKLFFSRYIYGDLYFILDGSRRTLQDTDNIILISAIANESYLLQYLEHRTKNVYTMTYEDHHLFSAHEISVLYQQYEHIRGEDTLIITTEKDATRLILHRDYIVEKKLPIYILPLQVKFMDNDGELFNETIKKFLIEFKV